MTNAGITSVRRIQDMIPRRIRQHAGAVTVPEDAAEQEKARQAAEEMTLKVTGQLGEPQPASVTVHAVTGFPAKELIEASRHADLLVVGSRGAGGFAKLLLGSVSSQVVHHSHCPVVVVPSER